MKATGIVRCVDNVGRIVIPKEIRKIFGIDIGTPVEFFVEDKSFIVKKYDVAGDVEQLLDNMEQNVRMISDYLSPVQYKAILKKMEEMKRVVQTKEAK